MLVLEWNHWPHGLPSVCLLLYCVFACTSGYMDRVTRNIWFLGPLWSSPSVEGARTPQHWFKALGRHRAKAASWPFSRLFLGCQSSRGVSWEQSQPREEEEGREAGAPEREEDLAGKILKHTSHWDRGPEKAQSMSVCLQTANIAYPTQTPHVNRERLFMNHMSCSITLWMQPIARRYAQHSLLTQLSSEKDNTRMQ